jgi:hypothetical protein
VTSEFISVRIRSESILSNNVPLFLSQAAPSPSFSIAEDELLSAAQIKLRMRWIELHCHRFELLRRRIREEGHRGSETLLAACPRRLVPFSRSEAKLCLPLPTILLPLPPLRHGGEILAVAVVRSSQGAWLGEGGRGRRSRRWRRRPSSFSSFRWHGGCLRWPRQHGDNAWTSASSPPSPSRSTAAIRSPFPSPTAGCGGCLRGER